MDKKKIGIIFGGKSPEYSISLESAYSVISNIDKNKYDIELIGISKDGNWFHFSGNIEDIKNDSWISSGKCTKIVFSSNINDHGFIEIDNLQAKLVRLDAVFPVLHGSNGEDGTVQGLIALSGIPMIGCKTLSSSLCMDKYLSHRLVQSYGINVAKSVVIDNHTDLSNLNNLLSGLSYPLFVKPMRAGSSFGVTKVLNKDDIANAISCAFEYDSEIIIEENVDGFEIGCAVMGNGNNLTVGEIDEIELSDGFFDFTEKYTLKTSKIHVPARISLDLSNKAKDIAKKIYKILKCEDFARVDMFLTPNGEIYFNEINTIPGFTAHSRYPTMMKKAGIEFEDLIDRLISSKF